MAPVDLVFVAVGVAQVGQRHEGAEDPVQLGDLGNVRLPEERRPGGVDAQRDEGAGRLEGEGPGDLGVLHRVERVEVGDEVQRLALVLQPNELPNRAVVVPEVETPRRLDAGENSHGRLLHRLGADVQTKGALGRSAT